jgi:hypothetical protein
MPFQKPERHRIPSAGPEQVTNVNRRVRSAFVGSASVRRSRPPTR